MGSVKPIDTVNPILDIYRHVVLDEQEGFQTRDGLPEESLIPIPMLSASFQEPIPELFGTPPPQTWRMEMRKNVVAQRCTCKNRDAPGQ